MVLDLCQEAPACPQHLVDSVTLIFDIHQKNEKFFQNPDYILYIVILDRHGCKIHSKHSFFPPLHFYFSVSYTHIEHEVGGLEKNCKNLLKINYIYYFTLSHVVERSW